MARAREGRCGDRRQELRFEVIGDLWAKLEVRPTCRLINIGEGGALVESYYPVRAGSRCEFSLTSGETTTLVTASVRHVSLSNGPSGAAYRIGLEFDNPDAGVRDYIRTMAPTAIASGEGTA